MRRDVDKKTEKIAFDTRRAVNYSLLTKRIPDEKSEKALAAFRHVPKY